MQNFELDFSVVETELYGFAANVWAAANLKRMELRSSGVDLNDARFRPLILNTANLLDADSDLLFAILYLNMLDINVNVFAKAMFGATEHDRILQYSLLEGYPAMQASVTRMMQICCDGKDLEMLARDSGLSLPLVEALVHGTNSQLRNVGKLLWAAGYGLQIVLLRSHDRLVIGSGRFSRLYPECSMTAYKAQTARTRRPG